jgi:hypothetical protein
MGLVQPIALRSQLLHRSHQIVPTAMPTTCCTELYCSTSIGLSLGVGAVSRVIHNATPFELGTLSSRVDFPGVYPLPGHRKSGLHASVLHGILLRDIDDHMPCDYYQRGGRARDPYSRTRALRHDLHVFKWEYWLRSEIYSCLGYFQNLDVCRASLPLRARQDSANSRYLYSYMKIIKR